MEVVMPQLGETVSEGTITAGTSPSASDRSRRQLVRRRNRQGFDGSSRHVTGILTEIRVAAVRLRRLSNRSRHR